MFDSNSPVVKIVGYLIIAFFALIIIISFGMPDFITDLSMDNSTIAIVNGQKVHRFDYLRYRKRFGNIQNQNMDDFILNYYIRDLLITQKAREVGFSVTDQKLSDTIKNEIKDFKNPQTGQFDPEIYKRVLEINHMDKASFYKSLRKNIINTDFHNFMRMGISVTSNEIETDYISENSKIQIKYAFLSENDIKKRYSSNLVVTEKDIDDALEKNKEEIKDPKSDRLRIKKKLEKEKLNKLKQDLADKVNKIASEKGSFTKSLAVLKVQSKLSSIFKAGEPVKENTKKAKDIPSISNSKIFLEECLQLNIGQTSRVIKTSTGLYVFTPVIKQIKGNPSVEEKEKISEHLMGQAFQEITGNYLKKIWEQSEIRKNIKTN